MDFFCNDFDFLQNPNNDFYKMLKSFEAKEKIYMATLMCSFCMWHHFDQREDVTKEKLIEEILIFYNDPQLAEKIFNNLVYDKLFLFLCDCNTQTQNQKYEINFKKYVTSDVCDFKAYKSYIHK